MEHRGGLRFLICGKEFLLERIPANRWRSRTCRTEVNGECDYVQIDGCEPTEVRSPDGQIHADVQRDHKQFQIQRNTDVNKRICFVVERCPSQQKVKASVEPRLKWSRLPGGIHS